MSKLLLILLFSIIFTLPSMLLSQTEPTDTDGDGYRNVSTLDHLRWISENSSSWADNFELDNDINAYGTRFWNLGKGWSPIGNNTKKFSGKLKGHNYSIDSLYSSRVTQDNVGLFGVIDGSNSTIENLMLKNITIFGRVNCGGLAAILNNGTIRNIIVSGLIQGGNNTAGIVSVNNGYIEFSENYAYSKAGSYGAGGIASENSGTITNCKNYGIINSSNRAGGICVYNTSMVTRCYNKGNIIGVHAGGIVYRNSGVISYCYSDCNIEIGDYSGAGFCVNNNSGTITKSFSKGSLSGGRDIGGFISYNQGYVANCFSFVSVQGRDISGGFVADNSVGGNVQYCYSIGEVTGNNIKGGLIGVGGFVYSSFWDIETSAQESSDGGIGKNTIDMKKKSTYSNWDFDNVWSIDTTGNINDGYPYLPGVGNNLIAPNLKLPNNLSMQIDPNYNFQWYSSAGALGYRIEISTNENFTNVVFTDSVTSTSKTASGLLYNQTYYWRVRAHNQTETSSWSEVRNFSTQGIPAPNLVSPSNSATDVSINATFDWSDVSDADSYQIQVATDNGFNNISVDATPSSSTYSGSTLGFNSTYYWRVRAKIGQSTGDWSSVWTFETAEVQLFDPPTSWDFDLTSLTHTVIVLTSIDPQIVDRDIANGDAIGAFYLDNGVRKCAGWEKWNGSNMGFSFFGDDDQTPEKDGFASGEALFFKVWDAQTGTEYDAEFTIQSGPTVFTSNGITTLGSLNAKTTTTHTIDLNQGWNMISTYVEPEENNIDSVFKDIKDDILIVKNGFGKIYVPQFQINTIGNWDLHQGYQVYSNTTQSLDIIGLQCSPEQEEILPLTGWNMLAYLRNTSMSAPTALASLIDRDNLLIAKNALGKIYVPQFQINTIGNLVSGQGYQMYISGLDTLVYPANGSGKQSIAIADPSATNLIPQNERTGSEMTLIVEAELENGSEIGIYDANDVLIGSGAFNNGKAGVTIWGDDEYTELKDGAAKGETLTAKVLQDGQLIEQELQISNIEGKEPINKLTYIKNAIVMAKINVQEELEEVRISPQPVVDNLNIEMPTGAKSIEIRDMKGKLMLELTSDQAIESIDVSDFTNGTYFITITTENKIFTEKFVKMK